jgi:hypothetical protein
MAQSWKATMLAVAAGGIAGAFLAPILAPAMARAARPAAKALIKAGMAVYQRGLETAGGLRETMEDAMAEIAAETSPAASEASVDLDPSNMAQSEAQPWRAVH